MALEDNLKAQAAFNGELHTQKQQDRKRGVEPDKVSPAGWDKDTGNPVVNVGGVLGVRQAQTDGVLTRDRVTAGSPGFVDAMPAAREDESPLPLAVVLAEEEEQASPWILFVYKEPYSYAKFESWGDPVLDGSGNQVYEQTVREHYFVAPSGSSVAYALPRDSHLYPEGGGRASAGHTFEWGPRDVSQVPQAEVPYRGWVDPNDPRDNLSGASWDFLEDGRRIVYTGQQVWTTTAADNGRGRDGLVHAFFEAPYVATGNPSPLGWRAKGRIRFESLTPVGADPEDHGADDSFPLVHLTTSVRGFGYDSALDEYAYLFERTISVSYQDSEFIPVAEKDMTAVFVEPIEQKVLDSYGSYDASDDYPDNANYTIYHEEYWLWEDWLWDDWVNSYGDFYYTFPAKLRDSPLAPPRFILFEFELHLDASIRVTIEELEFYAVDDIERPVSFAVNGGVGSLVISDLDPGPVVTGDTGPQNVDGKITLIRDLSAPPPPPSTPGFTFDPAEYAGTLDLATADTSGLGVPATFTVPTYPTNRIERVLAMTDADDAATPPEPAMPVTYPVFDADGNPQAMPTDEDPPPSEEDLKAGNVAGTTIAPLTDWRSPYFMQLGPPPDPEDLCHQPHFKNNSANFDPASYPATLRVVRIDDSIDPTANPPEPANWRQRVRANDVTVPVSVYSAPDPEQFPDTSGSNPACAFSEPTEETASIPSLLSLLGNPPGVSEDDVELIGVILA